MDKQSPINSTVDEFERWFDQYPSVFKSEVEAIRALLPEGEKLRGIEVGLATGRFSKALGILEGVEPANDLGRLAVERGIEVMKSPAEHLPYGDLRFDFVVMAFCSSHFHDLHVAFREAHRVLKNTGVLVVGFLDKHSTIGRDYEVERSSFYRCANFYTVEKVIFELGRAGFQNFSFRQTLFGHLRDIHALQPSVPGYGEGSFVAIQAKKAS